MITFYFYFLNYFCLPNMTRQSNNTESLNSYQVFPCILKTSDRNLTKKSHFRFCTSNCNNLFIINYKRLLMLNHIKQPNKNFNSSLSEASQHPKIKIFLTILPFYSYCTKFTSFVITAGYMQK